ncbi:RanGTP-binding protein [Blumeria hordei DH14]|uniref:RanGTP-binding protein n=1 Tax=Blumeria graminis f. sp. hordei (strain DH14) TaxID=546991 RepID=N1J529_BLUG1|nr:RanGTP-binding protein [Blumeria hordei DH14]
MEDFLGKVTQHAMNYAIRSGIGITASFAISQTTRLLRTVDNHTDYRELHSLQERLDSKIQVDDFPFDQTRSARGNTTLESAVTLTKKLRWDIQSLGVRLEKAASAEEKSRKKRERTKSRTAHETEIRQIVDGIKLILARIEDAVPLINLAITTSGASLSTTLPPSVSPSRLLQASTFLTTGDTQYLMSPNLPVQIGPTFTLSLYMLFAAHSFQLNQDEDRARSFRWKEIIHKARVRLVRTPISYPDTNTSIQEGHEFNLDRPTISPTTSKRNKFMAGSSLQSEYSYDLEIVEDLEDNRVHSIEENEHRPGSYGGVNLAGIREILPIYQIGKIFYADTGKILNIGDAGEASSPVLLLKRDINAQPPRKMMSENEARQNWPDNPENPTDYNQSDEEENETQHDVDYQLLIENSVHQSEETCEPSSLSHETKWRLPTDLDPEWLAFEVYSDLGELDSEDERDLNHGSQISSQQPSSSGEDTVSMGLAEEVSKLNLAPDASPSPPKQIPETEPFQVPATSSLSAESPFGLIRSSLSLLEMLIRLTALQQFQQASHLSIPDELLTFFLEESSTTGAGGNDEERRRTRREARRKVGFDPYDESPVKRHGEEYQRHHCGQQDSRGGTPRDYDNQEGFSSWLRDQPSTPEPWLQRNRAIRSPPKSVLGMMASSPPSPYSSRTRSTGPFRKTRNLSSQPKQSPLGRSLDPDVDSSLGTSPGSPVLPKTD